MRLLPCIPQGIRYRDNRQFYHRKMKWVTSKFRAFVSLFFPFLFSFPIGEAFESLVAARRWSISFGRRAHARSSSIDRLLQTVNHFLQNHKRVCVTMNEALQISSNSEDEYRPATQRVQIGNKRGHTKGWERKIKNWRNKNKHKNEKRYNGKTEKVRGKREAEEAF